MATRYSETLGSEFLTPREIKGLNKREGTKRAALEDQSRARVDLFNPFIVRVLLPLSRACFSPQQGLEYREQDSRYSWDQASSREREADEGHSCVASLKQKKETKKQPFGYVIRKILRQTPRYLIG